MLSKSFMGEDFLLQTETARRLYHEFAEGMPIFDYHNHLPPSEIAENRRFQTITQMWLQGDHYKWRAMRANGIDEELITGRASDRDRFKAWAETVPRTIRNPLYHWTHLELKKPFGIKNKLLDSQTADEIYDVCSEQLARPENRVRGLLAQWNVKTLCTTDDPADDLAYHKSISADSSFSIKVCPTFRPEKALAVNSPSLFNEWISRLEKAAQIEIKSFSDFLEALKTRHDFFHKAGCRISDQSILQPVCENFKKPEIETVFKNCREGNPPNQVACRQYCTFMMDFFAGLDAEKGWAHQLHLGPLRNNNSRMYMALGPDSGFDSMGDLEMVAPLGRFFDRLARSGRLPKVIVYNLNPKDSFALSAMLGNFQDSSTPGKMQYGAAWWHLDQKYHMEEHLNILSSTGLVSRFVGMLTDSRSFLSFSRHEYFRRVLCNVFGNDMENGELPGDITFIGGIVRDICYDNAAAYFGIT